MNSEDGHDRAPGTGNAIAGSLDPDLEGSCRAESADRIRLAPSSGGIERIEARFSGQGFAPHRHDTYAIGITLSGVQTFAYRGGQPERAFDRRGRPGAVSPQRREEARRLAEDSRRDQGSVVGPIPPARQSRENCECEERQGAIVVRARRIETQRGGTDIEDCGNPSRGLVPLPLREAKD